MKIKIEVPSVGESITQADIESWLASNGDLVEKGQAIVTLETDKASMDIPSPEKGILEIVKEASASVSVGEVIAYLDTSASQGSAQDSSSSNSSAKTSENSQANSSDKTSENSQANSSDKKTSSTIDPQSSNLGAGILSPAAQRLAGENNIDTSSIQGTGKDGRLSKEDILKALENSNSKEQSSNLNTPTTNATNQSSNLNAPTINATAANATNQSSTTNTPTINAATTNATGQRREKMTNLRRRTAERLVHSQNNTATLSTFNEVDMSRIIEIRKLYQNQFIKKHGVKLGFMSFFTKASISALKAFPKVNGFIDGTDIVYNDTCNIGVAVSTDKGVVVPVLFKAEDLSLAGIEKQLIVYRDKAISRQLMPDDLIGGTFTISNGGVFGSLLSTPILNPPQSGILGMHKIEKRPVVINDKIEIRPMMYLTLSYDHRIVDGRESVSFLVKVKEALEEPASLLMDI